MKEIEKYLGYYFLVYITVLVICGFFQYIAICQGKSLQCAFSMAGINTIITTTAYVITPVVAIIGFLSWRSQHNIKVYTDYASEVLKLYEQTFDLIISINKLHKYTEGKILSLDNQLLTTELKNRRIEELIEDMRINFYKELSEIESIMDRLIQKSVFLGYLVPESIPVTERSTRLKKELEIIKNCLNDVSQSQQISYSEGFHILKEICFQISEIAERNIEPCLSGIKKYIEA